MIKIIIFMPKMIILIFSKLIILYKNLMASIHQEDHLLVLENEMSIYLSIKNTFIDMKIFMNIFDHEFY